MLDQGTAFIPRVKAESKVANRAESLPVTWSRGNKTKERAEAVSLKLMTRQYNIWVSGVRQGKGGWCVIVSTSYVACVEIF